MRTGNNTGVIFLLIFHMLMWYVYLLFRNRFSIRITRADGQ